MPMRLTQIRSFTDFTRTVKMIFFCTSCMRKVVIISLHKLKTDFFQRTSHTLLIWYTYLEVFFTIENQFSNPAFRNLLVCNSNLINILGYNEMFLKF